jgi:hypothetical protein
MIISKSFFSLEVTQAVIAADAPPNHGFPIGVLRHGQGYGVHLGNGGAVDVDAALFVDGEFAGKWRVRAGAVVPVEGWPWRGTEEFVFYRDGSREAAILGAGRTDKSGLVVVQFRAEGAAPPTPKGGPILYGRSAYAPGETGGRDLFRERERPRTLFDAIGADREFEAYGPITELAIRLVAKKPPRGGLFGWLFDRP